MFLSVWLYFTPPSFCYYIKPDGTITDPNVVQSSINQSIANNNNNDELDSATSEVDMSHDEFFMKDILIPLVFAFVAVFIMIMVALRLRLRRVRYQQLLKKQRKSKKQSLEVAASSNDNDDDDSDEESGPFMLRDVSVDGLMKDTTTTKVTESESYYSINEKITSS